MEIFVTALDDAIHGENWAGALCIALTIPDMAGAIEEPGNGKSLARYSNWFDLWVGKKYQYPVGPAQEIHTFLAGTDCYALRCALLHEGSQEIEGRAQAVRNALDNFRFQIAPQRVHCNQHGRTLQIHVGTFCRDIIAGYRDWRVSIEDDAKKCGALKMGLSIH